MPRSLSIWLKQASTGMWTTDFHSRRASSAWTLSLTFARTIWMTFSFGSRMCCKGLTYPALDWSNEKWATVEGQWETYTFTWKIFTGFVGNEECTKVLTALLHREKRSNSEVNKCRQTNHRCDSWTANTAGWSNLLSCSSCSRSL